MSPIRMDTRILHSMRMDARMDSAIRTRFPAMQDAQVQTIKGAWWERSIRETREINSAIHDILPALDEGRA
ncbi:MAG TPA: hypothetical protein VM554_12950 [Acidisarcina sp.]|nr:hypothetical protein [Acidisarcina sp.]